MIALGQTPVVYSYGSAWQEIMGGTTEFKNLPLHADLISNWNVRFPAPAPQGYPKLVSMPDKFGGWSGIAPIQQVQPNAAIAGINVKGNGVDLDAISAS